MNIENTHAHTHTRPSDLQEDSRVLLVQIHQPVVGDGVNHPHGSPSYRHGNKQGPNMMAERNGGEEK